MAAQVYGVGRYQVDLRNLNLTKSNGTRVEFLSANFNTLRLVNDLAYLHAKKALTKVISSDDKLNDIFTEIKQDKDRIVVL